MTGGEEEARLMAEAEAARDGTVEVTAVEAEAEALTLAEVAMTSIVWRYPAPTLRTCK